MSFLIVCTWRWAVPAMYKSSKKYTSSFNYLKGQIKSDEKSEKYTTSMFLEVNKIRKKYPVE